VAWYRVVRYVIESAVDKKVKASKDGKQAERVRRAGVAAIPIGTLQVLRSDGSTVDCD